MTWNASCVCGVSLTQKLFGVGLRWLSHVQAHGFPCPRADLTHDGVVCDQVPLGNFRRRPGMVLSQRPVIKNIMFDSYSRYFLFIYFFKQVRDVKSRGSHLQPGSLLCTEYVTIGTFSMATSERSRDFLCFRLHRLRTSSDTVSRAATMCGERRRKKKRQSGQEERTRLESVPKLAQGSALTRQVRDALRVDLELVTVEVFSHQAEKHVQDAHRPCHGGGGRMPVA